MTADGLAEVYAHEGLDEVYRGNVDRIVSGFRKRFPGHRIDCRIEERALGFTIEYEGRSHELTLARSIGGSSRPGRIVLSGCRSNGANSTRCNTLRNDSADFARVA